MMTEEEYKKALADLLMMWNADVPDEVEFLKLAAQIEEYEIAHFPIAPPQISP